MCGLAGVFGINSLPAVLGSVINGVQQTISNQKTYLYKPFSTLMLIAQLRGDDSAGMFMVSSDKYAYHKETCPAATFINTGAYSKILESEKWDTVIGHARAATLGGLSWDMAHPHIYGTIMLVHNGTIRNHYTLLSGCPVGVSDSAALAWKLFGK